MKPLESLLGIALTLALAACQPKIGDSCQLSTDCSQTNASRICDRTMSKNGYCTVFNCEPNSCPSEAVCVAYGSTTSLASGCRTGLSGSRFQRTWCMKHCASDGDCRTGDGFRCVSVVEDNPWGAVVVDRGKAPTKICAVPYSGELIPEGRSTEVCSSEGDGDLPRPLSEAVVTDAGGSRDASTDVAVTLADGSASDASATSSDASGVDATLDASVDAAP